MYSVSEYIEMEKSESFFLPWLVCFSASLFFFYEFIQGNMFASIADNIMYDFHIHADKMAYLSSAYYVSNVSLILLAGMILDRFSSKKTILFAMFLCVISTFVLSYANSFYIALTCRFITGIGSAFCFLGPIRVASRWFEPKQMAMVTGAVVTMAMTGGMVAQYPMTKLVALVGWRDAVMDVGWLGLGMLVFMYFGIVDRPGSKEVGAHPEVSFKQLKHVLRTMYCNAQILRAGLYTCLMNMGIAVLGAMIGTLYLMQRLGVSKEQAALANSMLFLGTIIGGPVIGWISDKIGLRILPMKIGVIASLAVALCILYAPVSLVEMKILFFLLGFCTAAQIISYALVSESNSPMLTATALSVVSTVCQSGYILFQNIFSSLLVHHGGMNMVNGVPIYALSDYQFAISILPIGLVFAGLCLLKLKETHCRRVTA